MSQIIFSLTNLQEFFYNSGSKDYITFQRDPILTIPTAFGSIAVEYGATFGAMGNRIDSHIWSENREAIGELQEAYTRVKEKYPNETFMVRKNIEVQIRITLTQPEKVDTAYKHVVHLQELFAVLSHQPVYPVSVTIRYASGSGQQTTVPAVPSLLLDESTINQAKRELPFFLRPINIKTIDLASTIEKWLSLRDGFESVVSRIQAETGIRTPLTVREELVMLISQLEGIAVIDGSSGKYERYQYTIDKYASAKVKDGILSMCTRKIGKDIGSAISDVRNEIVHLGKPGRVLDCFDLLDLVYLAQYLRAVITGYILVLLGIEPPVSHSYQDYFTH